MTALPSKTLVLAASPYDRQLAQLAALGIILSIVDASFPSPLPGVKPGLANLATLLALEQLGWWAAVNVMLLRVLAASLLLGSLLTPGFWLSLSGAVCSLCVLGLARHLPSRWFGLMSLSQLSALGHIAGQILVARVWLLPSAGILYFVPVLAASAWLTGMLNGVIAQRLLRKQSSLC